MICSFDVGWIYNASSFVAPKLDENSNQIIGDKMADEHETNNGFKPVGDGEFICNHVTYSGGKESPTTSIIEGLGVMPRKCILHFS